MNKPKVPLATAWKSIPGIKAHVFPRLRATCMHCGFEPDSPDEAERFYETETSGRRVGILRAVAERQGEGVTPCSSHLIVEQAAHRFFQLVAVTTDGMRGRFSEREWTYLLSCQPSRVWPWDRRVCLASMVANDQGVESLDELADDSELRALLVKLLDLTPLESATLVDACERVWRGLENPLR